MKTPETSDVTSSQTGAVGASRLKASVVFTALIAAVGGLLFGFDTAVISGTTDWLKGHYNLNGFWQGFTVTSALIGTMIGAIAVGRPADTMGRRSVLFILAVFYFVSAIGCAMAWDWWSFIAFRILGGVAVGGASVASPMYIAEIAPAKFRGRLVAFAQFNIVVGVLLAYLSNYIILNLNLGEVQYRWMFGVMALPSAVFFLLLFLTPQSPRWLVAQNRLAEARVVLEKCGTDSGVVEDEVREIQSSLDTEHHALTEPFFCRKYLKPIMLAVAIAMFNQLSGINAILYYSNHIFETAHASAQLASLQSVILGFINLVVTVAAMAIIDHFGRRRLMIVGSIGYIVSLIVTAYAFYTSSSGPLVLISLLVFIASHAFGQGAVIWVFIGEIFPNRVRARGQALGTFTHWFMCSLIVWTFPIIADTSGGNAFAFFAVCMVGQLIWVLLVMPETKGISLERIQKHLGIE